MSLAEVIELRPNGRLEELEGVISAGKRTFYEVGCALREIREDKLYKEKNGGEFKTFEAYCRKVWGWGRDYPNKQIRAANAVEFLDTRVSKIDLTEKLIRPLTKLDEPEDQIACFQEAQELAETEGRPLAARHVAFVVKERLDTREDPTAHSPIIKPSDNWNFSPVVYGRIDGDEGHGYIPGEIYANCFWYYTKPGDIVVDPMAGSGQIFRVYDDRARWMRPERWELDIRAFDLKPRGPYCERIGKHDLRSGFPIDHADYIFMDIPYFGMVVGQYSDASEDIANMDFANWCESMKAIAWGCSGAQAEGGLLTIVSPNFRDAPTHTRLMTTQALKQEFIASGYDLFDIAYASRRIQQTQSPEMARHNIMAKRERVMLTDISEVITFRRAATLVKNTSNSPMHS